MSKTVTSSEPQAPASPRAAARPATVDLLQAMLTDPGRSSGDRFSRRLDILNCIPRIRCTDGFSLSVQSGRTHYCTPRDNAGPWSKVEVGFPSARVEEFMPYIDGSDSNPTDTVYGWVPIETVAAVIDSHGGIKS